MKKIFPVIAVFLLTSGLPQLYAQPFSDFSVDLESWTASCESPCAVTPAPQGWNGVNGNSAGCFKVTDNANGVWYYHSPAEFNIDLTSYYGGTLEFDLKQNGSAATQFNDNDVMLVKSDGTRIVYNTPTNPLPANTWVSYSVSLSETGWKYTNLAGASVTAGDMLTFLSTFVVIKIRGDYSTSNFETAWLDNVELVLPPMLPVELTSFSGTQVNINTVELAWETASEQNTNYFQVEKSNNLSEFIPIGSVGAAGNSSAQNDYRFNDDNFTGEGYYRLKTVDFDNTVNYSHVIHVEGDSENAPIKIHPNPTSDIINIQYNSALAVRHMKIVDSYGRTVMQDLASGNSAGLIKLDIHSLPEGIYYVMLSGNDHMKTAPFQVIHP